MAARSPRRSRLRDGGRALSGPIRDCPNRLERMSSRMAPILYKISLTIPFYGPVALPIYGFGIMLVMAFIFAPWLAWWRARREGLDGDVVLDMGFWIFV